jgi:hypothetical protein
MIKIAKTATKKLLNKMRTPAKNKKSKFRHGEKAQEKLSNNEKSWRPEKHPNAGYVWRFGVKNNDFDKKPKE